MSKQLRIVFNDDVTQEYIDLFSDMVTQALENDDVTAVIFVEDVPDEEEGSDGR